MRHNQATRKRQRENLLRRTRGWPVSTSTGLVALLACMSSSSTELVRSIVPAVNAFVPSQSRFKGSNSLGRVVSTLAPKPIFATNDDELLPTRTDSTSSPSVEVWDGVFSVDVCEDLHELAIDHSERTTGEDDEDEEDDDDSLQGSSIFYHRGPNRSTNDQLTPIEQAIDSFLTAYYNQKENDDPNREIVVEYWCRQEHLNLEAHADVDEVTFERSSDKNDPPTVRYPTIGHVLYLTKPTLGVGPTCVFPPTAESSSIKDEIDTVVTIPAMPGRVLRFPGNALHGVPKPADVWFSNSEEIEDNDDEDTLDEEWWEDDDDDEERSVILFNTWERYGDDTTNSGPVGPVGVPVDPMFHVKTDIDVVDMMMSSVDMDDGVQVDEEFVQGMVSYAKQLRDQKLNDWKEDFCTEGDSGKMEEGEPLIYSKVHCQPIESWKSVPIQDTSANSPGDKGSIRVPLMGDEKRRRYPKNTVRWTVSSCFEEGVKEVEQPCQFPLFAD